ncbi:MAG: hypothetical protein H6825_06720 [Planctomycetes bacterium]|nr:hypothetical protein [Planctomycetota bacterium]
MTSARTSLLLALLALVPASPRRAHGSVAPRGCEPSGPVSIALSGHDTPDGQFALDYTLTPRLDGSWLGLELELPHGGRIRVHEPPAASPWVRGESRSGHALVELPDDARRGEHAAELHVVAYLGLPQPDGAVERIGSEAATLLGSGRLPVTGREVRAGALATLDVAARHEGGAR